jgi:prepilin-type N-terminal cleavage/methylation domain-containing protein
MKCALHPSGRRAGFTLPEVIMASLISLVVAGTLVFLLWQGALEQRQGLALATVEQVSHQLEARLIECLRTKSANQGLSPDFTTAVYDSDSHLLGYERVFLFYCNSDGSYRREQLALDSGTKRAIHTPDVTKPSVQVILNPTNSAVALRQLYFNRSFNLDGSVNASLVNVCFAMDDNGAGRHSPTNNPASIYRTFSVRMRSDS